jgi:hypothetical protein
VDTAAAAAASSAAAGVTAAGINAVPTARLVAGQALSADVPASTLTGALSAATTTAKGTVEIATGTEVNDWAAPSAVLAVTPATLPVRVWLYNYASSSWPTLPATAPAGLGLIMAMGPTEPGAGQMPTWAGIGDGKVRVQFVIDPAAP